MKRGPLAGIRVLELEAAGPTPFCGMMLADMGAEVVLVDRRGDTNVGLPRERWYDVMLRGRRSIAVDLKTGAAREAMLAAIEKADVLIEGFRPGVMERLGLGPEAALARNPRLVYGRMTGWGQSGPLAARAGHDINYLALSGVLAAIGPREGVPLPPLNVVADFGGGGMMLAFGVACALLEARRSGKGQVIDAAMLEGASLLGAMFRGFIAAGRWSETRGANFLDGGAPWYGVYETRDAQYMAVGAIEPRFYEEMVGLLGLRLQDLPAQDDASRWPELRDVLARTFKSKTREEWTRIFEGADACVTPVLAFSETPSHPHAASRESFMQVGRVLHPAPAPRFSFTPADTPLPPPERNEGGATTLESWGVDPGVIARALQ